MKQSWLVLLAMLFLLAAPGGSARAANFADDTCPDAGGTQFVVDTAAKAATVANGYNKAACDLIIQTSLNDNPPSDILDATLSITAKTITITGPDVLVPGKRVEIINKQGSGDVVLTAEGVKAGDVAIDITEGNVRARDLLRLICDAPNCKINVLDSDIVATLNLDLNPVGGDLRILADGDIKLEGSSVFAGDVLHIRSFHGNIIWHCGGTTSCKDPLLSGVAATLCPGGFPCTVTFPTAKALTQVCIPAGGGTCGGPSKELRVQAKLQVDIRGSTITAGDHCIFVSETLDILAGPLGGVPAAITCEEIRMTAQTGIDVHEAVLTATAFVNLTVGNGCPPAANPFPGNVCLNARKADIQAKDIKMIAANTNGVVDTCDGTFDETGSQLPSINSDNTPPYDPNVIDTAAECTAAGGAGPGTFL
jgi:hypothetical protein